MDAERLMRFTLVLVVLTLVTLILCFETAPPAPAPAPTHESASRFDWLEGEQSVIEIGVPPEPPPELPAWITDDTPAPPPPETPVEAPPRELLERARAEGREEARRAIIMGNPVLMGAGYRAVGRRVSDPTTGLDIATIGDDIDPYQVEFIDAYNKEIQRRLDSGQRDVPPDEVRTELGRLLRRIHRSDNERFIERLGEGESPDGTVLTAYASMVVIDLDRERDGLLEGTRLMIWEGTERIALVKTFLNSRVCRIEHLFSDTRVAEGMTVSNPFFESNRSLKVALDHPGETTDVAAVRDRLQLLGARLVASTSEADVIVRLDPHVTPIPGKIVVDSRALRTFLDLRP